MQNKLGRTATSATGPYVQFIWNDTQASWRSKQSSPDDDDDEKEDFLSALFHDSWTISDLHRQLLNQDSPLSPPLLSPHYVKLNGIKPRDLRVHYSSLAKAANKQTEWIPGQTFAQFRALKHVSSCFSAGTRASGLAFQLVLSEAVSATPTKLSSVPQQKSAVAIPKTVPLPEQKLPITDMHDISSVGAPCVSDIKLVLSIPLHNEDITLDQFLATQALHISAGIAKGIHQCLQGSFIKTTILLLCDERKLVNVIETSLSAFRLELVTNHRQQAIVKPGDSININLPMCLPGVVHCRVTVAVEAAL